MSTIGQIEKRTQQRVVRLFREQLDYDYLGDWSDREGNRTVFDFSGYQRRAVTPDLFRFTPPAGVQVVNAQ